MEPMFGSGMNANPLNTGSNSLDCFPATLFEERGMKFGKPAAGRPAAAQTHKQASTPAESTISSRKAS